MTDGNPDKLYRPWRANLRDFQGTYCAIEENRNDGPNTKDMPKLSCTMNLTSVVDQISQQAACSTAVAQILTEDSSSSNIAPLMTTEEERENHLYDRFLSLCEYCKGKTNNGGDLSSVTDVQNVISAHMANQEEMSAQAGDGGAGGDETAG